MALTWEDKEIRFDLPYADMHLTSGEKVIDRLEHIEDTKGNSGDRGRLVVTNLRIIWHSIMNPRISLSIGHNCIISITTKVVNSRLQSLEIKTMIASDKRKLGLPTTSTILGNDLGLPDFYKKLKGTTQALHLLTSSNNTRFEFIFTNLVPGNMRHFTSVMGVHKAFTSSRLYRELKLRGAVIHNKQLKMLPLEQVFTTLHGVWNLSSDQGSPGTFIITNVRLVWFADMNEGFNISLPYLQIDSIRIRDSKFGTALVVTSTEMSGGYVLGFRIIPEEKLQTVLKELSSLSTVYTNSPIYGVEYKWSTVNDDEFSSKQLIEDVEEIEEPKGEMSNVLSAYLADEGHTKDRPPMYSKELGLAIETVKEGFVLHKLWEVIPG